jgi:hypothetical protein
LLPEIRKRLKASGILYFFDVKRKSLSYWENGGFSVRCDDFLWNRQQESQKFATNGSRVRFFVYFRVIEFIRQILSPFDWTQISLPKKANSRVTVELLTPISSFWRVSSLPRKAGRLIWLKQWGENLAQRRAESSGLGQ